MYIGLQSQRWCNRKGRHRETWVCCRSGSGVSRWVGNMGFWLQDRFSHHLRRRMGWARWPRWRVPVAAGWNHYGQSGLEELLSRWVCCHSCHHESRRQLQSLLGSTGRRMPPYSPALLLSLIWAKQRWLWLCRVYEQQGEQGPRHSTTPENLLTIFDCAWKQPWLQARKSK